MLGQWQQSSAGSASRRLNRPLLREGQDAFDKPPFSKPAK